MNERAFQWVLKLHHESIAMLSLVTNYAAPAAWYVYENWKTIAVTSAVTLLATKIINSIPRDAQNKFDRTAIVKAAIGAATSLPGAGIIVDHEMRKEIAKMEASIFAHRTLKSERFPDRGETPAQILRWLETVSQDSKFKAGDGKLSGTLYCDDRVLIELQTRAEALAGRTNTLHPEVNPWVLQCEAECIHWAREIFGGDYTGSDVCGFMTSGGSGSIFHACWAYRNRAKSKGITEPEMVVPVSAHSAFKKAAQILGMKIVEVPIDPETLKVNLNALERSLTPNTAMVVGSAPAYSYGIADNIEGISEIVIRKGNELTREPFPLHVDACLGGFVLAFLEKAGITDPAQPVEKFDFRVPGVTSLSADNHKFGNAEKGASTLLYRNKQLRSYQYFTDSNAHIGIYGSPGQEGSQSGKAFISAWVAMLYFGKHGYRQLADAIVKTCSNMESIIKGIPTLKVIGEPQYMVVAFQAENILNIQTAMSQKGWDLNVVKGPHGKPAVHFCVTSKHALDPAFIERFRRDLLDSVQNPAAKLEGSASSYGSSMIFPADNVEQAMRAYFDVLLQVKPGSV